MTFSLPRFRNFGNEVTKLSPSLANQLSDMYSDIANSLSLAIKKNVLDGVDPQANEQRNASFSVGDIAVRTDNNKAWIMTSRTTATAVTWTLIT